VKNNPNLFTIITMVIIITVTPSAPTNATSHQPTNLQNFKPSSLLCPDTIINSTHTTTRCYTDTCSTITFTTDLADSHYTIQHTGDNPTWSIHHQGRNQTYNSFALAIQDSLNTLTNLPTIEQLCTDTENIAHLTNLIRIHANTPVQSPTSQPTNLPTQTPTATSVPPGEPASACNIPAPTNWQPDGCTDYANIAPPPQPIPPACITAAAIVTSTDNTNTITELHITTTHPEANNATSYTKLIRTNSNPQTQTTPVWQLANTQWQATCGKDEAPLTWATLAHLNNTQPNPFAIYTANLSAAYIATLQTLRPGAITIRYYFPLILHN
jgi:hypothetical protein